MGRHPKITSLQKKRCAQLLRSGQLSKAEIARRAGVSTNWLYNFEANLLGIIPGSRECGFRWTWDEKQKLKEQDPNFEFLPTDARPGSNAKIMILRDRVAAGFPLWHPGDVTYAGRDHFTPMPQLTG